MCKAIDFIIGAPCHKKPQHLIEMSKSAVIPVARKPPADHILYVHSAIAACAGVGLTGADLLRLLVTAIWLVLVSSLVGHSSSGWISFLMEVVPSIAEDLGALALLFLLCLLTCQAQNRMQASPPCGTRTKLDDLGDDFGLEDRGSKRPRGTSSARKTHRRRHTLQRAFGQLNDVVRSVTAGSAEDAIEQFSPGCGVKVSAAQCGLYNYHTKCPRNLLLPVEVAACQYPPDVNEHLQRLLEDRWAVALIDGVSVSLASIPE